MEARHVRLEVLGSEEERDELGAPLLLLEDDEGVAGAPVLREQQPLDLPLALADALLEPPLLPPLPPQPKGAPRPRALKDSRVCTTIRANDCRVWTTHRAH